MVAVAKNIGRFIIKGIGIMGLRGMAVRVPHVPMVRFFMGMRGMVVRFPPVSMTRWAVLVAMRCGGGGGLKHRSKTGPFRKNWVWVNRINDGIGFLKIIHVLIC